MEGAPKPNQETPEANPWESLAADLEAVRKKKESEEASADKPQWDPRLTPEQIDDMIQRDIYEPVGQEYERALIEFGLKPMEKKEASADKPQWDPRLTPEQIDDMIQKGIYEPAGPEYEQALGEFGITDATAQGQEQTQTQTAAEGVNDQSIIDENGIRTEDYLASEQGKRELNSEAEFDRLAAKLEQAVKDGRMTEEHAKALLEKQLNKAIDNIDGIRQDYKDAQVVGTPEEQAAYQAWLEAHDAENIKNLERRGQLSEEEKAKLEAEERAKLEEEERKKLELEKLKQEQEKDQKALDEEKKKLEELEKRRQELEEAGPLTAINADFTYDMKELAHDRAERMINAEKEKAGLIKRIWKHTLFKKYYQKKYERQILAGERTFGKDEEGDDITIGDIIEDRSGSAIERFVKGATEDMHYIHQDIGGNGGEKLAEADAETTQLVREAIEEFAQAKIPEDGTLEDLRREFGNKIKRLQAEAKDQGRNIDNKLINNYFEVAVQARERVEHGIAMEKVMEGFKVYNADVRNNARSESHRDNVDKIIDKLESSKIGRFIPAEIIAAGVGMAYALTQTGARSAARIAAPIGGIFASGAIAGLRERNRVTEDRTRMMRDAAVNMEYSGTSGEEVKGHLAKKRAKYEAKIGGTIYDLRPASELIEGLKKATESGDSEEILKAIAEARVRIDFSDSEQKDLISYSSEDKIGDERFALDDAVIKAEKSLSEEDKKKLETMKSVVLKEIANDVDEKDKDFKKIRTAQAIKQAGKTIAVGSVVFFGSQEIMAAVDPNKIGLFEKAGIIKTTNNEDAQETILAGLAGPRVQIKTHKLGNVLARSDEPSKMQKLRNDGYTETLVKKGGNVSSTQVVDIDPSKSTSRIKVAYDGWANNGTSYSDGNELRMYLSNGQIYSGMSGASTMGNSVLDYNAADAAGRIKGYLTIGNSKFEIVSHINSAGQRTWGENGVFTTTAGETIKAIDDNGKKLYKFFEIALDNGKDTNGVSHIIPFATDAGADSFSGKIQKVIETTVKQPDIYEYTKTITEEIPRGVDSFGLFAPAPRVGLGDPRERSTEGGSSEGEDGGATVIVDNSDRPPEMITGAEAERIADNVARTAEQNPTDNTNANGVASEVVTSTTTGESTTGATAANTTFTTVDDATNGAVTAADVGESTTGATTANGATSTTTNEATATPNRAPNQAEDREQSEFANHIKNEFGDSINDDILNLMTDKSSGADDETTTRINGLWGNLNQDTRNKLIDYYNREDPPYGQAFKVFVKNQLPPPPAATGTTGNVAA